MGRKKDRFGIMKSNMKTRFKDEKVVNSIEYFWKVK
jgi:hypothetical protein